MCAVSAIFDQYYDRWNQPYAVPNTGMITLTPYFPSQAEIAEFRELLEKARQWDIDHNEPDCESEIKRQKLRDLAEELGVEIEFI